MGSLACGRWEKELSLATILSQADRGQTELSAPDHFGSVSIGSSSDDSRHRGRISVAAWVHSEAPGGSAPPGRTIRAKNALTRASAAASSSGSGLALRAPRLVGVTIADPVMAAGCAFGCGVRFFGR